VYIYSRAGEAQAEEVHFYHLKNKKFVVLKDTGFLHIKYGNSNKEEKL